MLRLPDNGEPIVAFWGGQATGHVTTSLSNLTLSYLHHKRFELSVKHDVESEYFEACAAADMIREAGPIVMGQYFTD